MVKSSPGKKHRQDDGVELVAESTTQGGKAKVQPAAEPVQPSAAAKGHLAAMEEQFECAVCKDWLVAPFSVHPCGHLLCGDCLRQWLEKSKTCPCCRANCTAPPVRAIAVENLIVQLVEPNLEADEIKYRKQHKAAWDRKSADVVKRWQKDLTPAAVTARPAAPHAADLMHGQAASPWGLPDFMNFPGGRWFAMGSHPAPHPIDVPLQSARRSADPGTADAELWSS
ncbi:hypothetical protein WJX84_012035 [Apatococcus fuscideae]|uniref:RING-type domain-containing protein n=1 Tax=Apatococcus fuscideae TaxID=2026836 RepID=A0AAW1SUE2_9CHLO